MLKGGEGICRSLREYFIQYFTDMVVPFEKEEKSA
jgi:hypothetical protein